MSIDDFADPLHGRCDTCGARCDADGCTRNRNHLAAIGEDDIVRTVYTIEVFSRGAYEPHDDETMTDLESISFDIDQGDCIGEVTLTSSNLVAPGDLVKELQRIGNDGSFFDRT